MFSKNNIKYILVLFLGFFWCSSVYLTQEQYLTNYASDSFIQIAELLFGSLSMALGILVFGLLYRKNKYMIMYYTIFTLLAIVSMITFFGTKNIYLMSVCLCTTCFFGTAGFGAGYHFSLLASNVEKEYRGRVFAIGYGLGSVGTYLLILLPESFYSSISSLALYIPVVIINLLLVAKHTRLIEVKEEKNVTSVKEYFLKMSIIILAMSLLSALSTDIIALHTINISGGYGNTRLYYCLGLLIAGYLADKKNVYFELLTIISFIFSLLAIILLNDNYSIKIIAGLSYSFVAFFVVYRTISFVNIIDKKKSMVWVAAFGLMYSRIIEGLMVLFEDILISKYILLITLMSLMLSMVIVIYFFSYYVHKTDTLNDKIKQVVIKYKLSIQEEKVLVLLVDGKSNQEIANELYISVYTVKRHIANIYQKTGMKKKELVEKCYN